MGILAGNGMGRRSSWLAMSGKAAGRPFLMATFLLAVGSITKWPDVLIDTGKCDNLL